MAVCLWRFSGASAICDEWVGEGANGATEVRMHKQLFVGAVPPRWREWLVAKMCAIKNFMVRRALGANSTQYRDIARTCNDTHDDATEF